MATQTSPSKQTSADTASRQKRRHLNKYREDAAGKYTKVRNVCEWDRDSVGNLFAFETEAQLLEHEARCGERRKRGEYPAGGYESVPAEQRALAQNINEHTRETVETEVDGLHLRLDQAEARQDGHDAKLDRLLAYHEKACASDPEGLDLRMVRTLKRFPVDHAAVRTNLERGGFTAPQLIQLYRAARLEPPTRRNAQNKDVVEKAKYLLAQGLCRAAGSGEHEVHEGQLFDYHTLSCWMAATRHQRHIETWQPPVCPTCLPKPAQQSSSAKRKRQSMPAPEGAPPAAAARGAGASSQVSGLGLQGRTVDALRRRLDRPRKAS